MNNQSLALFRSENCFSREGFPFEVRKVCLNSGVKAHRHDFYEIVFIVSGEGLHRTIYGDHPLQAGDLFCFRPLAWHAYLNCQKLILFNCLIGTKLINQELAWLRETGLWGSLFWARSQNRDRIDIPQFNLPQKEKSRTIRHLEKLSQQTNAKSNFDKLSIVVEFLSMLKTIRESLNEQTKQSIHEEICPRHSAVVQGVELLEQNMSEEWDLARLSQSLNNINRSYLVRLFKQELGYSPMAYLKRCRAEESAFLLLQSNLSLTDIASKVGWPDPNYFSRCFRQHFGISPTQYRKRNRF